MNMSSRRTHTKSRNGCKECKRRKVKCDESYPCCFNCARHGVVCSLGSKTVGDGIIPCTLPAGGFLPSLEYLSETSVSPSTAFSNLTHLLDTGRAPAVSSSTASSEHAGHALELMHHYCMHTADTLAYRDEIRQVWKGHVPELGYRCPYVMNGLLAIAALHKAVLLPSQSDIYLDLAAYYQTLGLQQFLKELHSINADTWQQAFCFSSTVVLYALCTPAMKKKEVASSALQQTADMLTFSRGLRAIVIPSQTRLGTTKLRPLAAGIIVVDENDPSFHHPRLENSPLPRDIFDALEKLRDFLDRLPIPRRDSYHAAVDDLTKAGYLVAHGGMQPELGMVIFWCFVAPDNVVTDIQSGDPHGLLILGYLAVLFAVLEPRFWYFRSWPKVMFRAIDENLADADGMFAEMLAWPRRQVFETLASG